MQTAVHEPTPRAPARSLDTLLRRSRPELEALYRTLAPGPIPDGESRGVASALPGTAIGELSEIVCGLAWQGKVFDRAEGTLVNKILGLLRGVKARVYEGESWLDGGRSIVIDYKGTSWLCAGVRDEIRMVSPGLYLGFAYLRLPRPQAPLLFALEFPEARR